LISARLRLAAALALCQCASGVGPYAGPDAGEAAAARVVVHNTGASSPLAGVTSFSMHVYSPHGACDPVTGENFEDAYRGSLNVDLREREFTVEGGRYVFLRLAYLQYDDFETNSCNFVFGFLPGAQQRYDLELLVAPGCGVTLTGPAGPVPLLSPAVCFARW
jgi:hypothetical protein